ncbi:hypothetical protein DFH09DRAFT_1377351 [Mycena vulgaris]|nr:hypothetical protein DFH09DRAFT_1377351 [Mycena vulgaris]
MSFSPTSTLLFGSPGLTNVQNQVKGLIEAAEANIERLTAQIRELTCLRERERTILATLRMMVVPIGKLPTELLVEIFKHAVDTPLFDDTPISVYAPYESMFDRGVSVLAADRPQHTAPQLWTEGVVEVNLDNNADDAYMRGLKDLLARSSPFPISVSLTATSKNAASVTSAALSRTTLNTAQRWRNLNLHLVPFSHFNGLDPGTFETLERLHIKSLHETEPLTAFQSSPLLRHFILQESYALSSLFQLPWSQLTHLRIGDESLGSCRKILLQCSNLVSGHFITSHHWDFGEEAVQSPVVALPFLRTLSITLSDGLEPTDETGGIEVFFLPLALPSLQTLHLEFDPETDDYWPTDVFSQFQSRSPNIEEISLIFCQIESEGFLALLRHAPALTMLHLECCWNCITTDVLAALRYDGGDSSSGPLVPKLQDIHLEYIGPRFEESLFEDAIRSRWWTDERAPPGASPPRVVPLKKVLFLAADAECDLSTALKARMRELVGQGLDLNLH